MIREGKRRGYSVCTNTTVYRETSMDEVEELCRTLTALGIDGILLAPGYRYEKVEGDHFLAKQEVHEKFQRVLELAKRYPISSTPLFLQFAAGQREYPCTPWGNPTRTPKGWKGPCYLIEDAYYPTWQSFWRGVDWDYWETRQDERCRNCLMLVRSPWSSSRYGFATGVLVLLMVLGGTRAEAGPMRAFFGAVVLGAALIRGAVLYPSGVSWQPGWPRWPSEVAAWQIDASRPLRIWPPPWTVTLRR